MTKTRVTLGARVRVVRATYHYWNPDGLRDGDTGSITKTMDGGDLVDFKRDDGTMYPGLAVERFEVIEEEPADPAPKYKFSFRAEKSYRDQTSRPIGLGGYTVMTIPETIPVSVIAETKEKAVELALELLPKTIIPGHFWSLEVLRIEVQA